MQIWGLRAGGVLLIACAGLPIVFHRDAARDLFAALIGVAGAVILVVTHIYARRFDDPDRMLPAGVLAQLPPTARGRAVDLTLVLADRSVVRRARCVAGCVVFDDDSGDLRFRVADVVDAYPHEVLVLVSRALAAFDPVPTSDAAADVGWYDEEAAGLLARLRRGSTVNDAKDAIEEVFVARWPTLWRSGPATAGFQERWTSAAQRIVDALQQPPGHRRDR